MKIGDVTDFRTFMGAVIDRKAFTKISGYLEDARKNARIIQGGGAKDDVGYFVEPTLVETKDPGYRLMCEEIFGPVLTVYAYPDAEWERMLDVVDRTSPYALTGAVFMILADILSRTIIPGQVLPIGVITALIGAPAFALILAKGRARA